MDIDDFMKIFNFDVDDGFDLEDSPDDSNIPAETSTEVLEATPIDDSADTLALLPGTNELVRSPSESAKPTR